MARERIADLEIIVHTLHTVHRASDAEEIHKSRQIVTGERNCMTSTAEKQRNEERGGCQIRIEKQKRQNAKASRRPPVLDEERVSTVYNARPMISRPMPVVRYP